MWYDVVQLKAKFVRQWILHVARMPRSAECGDLYRIATQSKIPHFAKLSYNLL